MSQFLRHYREFSALQYPPRRELYTVANMCALEAVLSQFCADFYTLSIAELKNLHLENLQRFNSME